MEELRGGSKCSAMIWSGFSQYQCQHKAKVLREGKPYCGVHDPKVKAERDKKSHDRWDRENKISSARWAVEEAEEAIVDAVCAARRLDLPSAVIRALEKHDKAVAALKALETPPRSLTTRQETEK